MKCTFQDVRDILHAHGFVLVRQNGTSHAQYRGVVNGEVRMTTVAGKPSDDVNPDTLSSIIRQSGLPKKLFRK
ncbi:hypothetical protein DK419_27110 [Methylobacterium terrae]|uniref:Addiction module toxin, HicA family n=1 Tax=Methylobacterium terrae TaxID=2202827 RepID=A0A2U8WVZ4_9HYPH|nr:hypothetical protein DK419_27110 [Methylobacterium terrae]